MSRPRLSRRAGHGRVASPVRLVHLGLGNFFRAHQAWYTDRCPDARSWGIAAFTGRSTGLADALTAQDGLHTVITRSADGDRFDLLTSLSQAHSGADHGAWLSYLASPQVRVVTLTVTEAGYLRRADGGLDRNHPAVRADVAALRRDLTAPVRTAPARLVAGYAARRRADAGAITVVPCDNLPDNGPVASRVVQELAELVAPDLADWLAGSVSYATTMVDRITPKTTPDDLRAVAEATGLDDRAAVVTEPFSEWVLSGTFHNGRPRWEDAGARFTADVAPFEQRKLWLLNGAHSLLAYAGSARGHRTVAEAVADDTCRGWLEDWWSEASRYLSLPATEVATYRAALLQRFTNPRIQHRLDQIAADGSQKLPVRVLPALRRERSAGRPSHAATRILAAWVCHLRGSGAPVDDVRADDVMPLAAKPLPEAVRRILEHLDPAMGSDDELVSAVLAETDRIRRPTRS